MKTINESIRQRILAIAAQFEGRVGCWEWPRSRNKASGYGQLSTRINGKSVVFTAHRAIFEAMNGPQALCVLHRCDNPPCFNPAHLFAGTMKDNMDDMWRKGRQHDRIAHAARGDRHRSRTSPETLKRGEENNKAKLTEEKVRAIRASTETLAVLSARYGVSQVALSAVRRRKTWKHLP